MVRVVVLARLRRALRRAGLAFTRLPAGSALADITVGARGSTPGLPFECFAGVDFLVTKGSGGF
jgi:hypothetical protein